MNEVWEVIAKDQNMHTLFSRIKLSTFLSS